MKLFKACLIMVLVLSIIGYGAVRMNKNRKIGQGPVILSTMDQITVPFDYTEKELLKGLRAYDREEGDLTKDILIRNFSKFTEPGTAELEYVVFDSSNNFGTYKRKVTFADYRPPKITLKETIVFTEKEVSDFSILAFLEGTDCLDGDLSKHLKVEKSDVNFEEPGTYKLSVSLQNFFGDTTVMDLPVHIIRNRARGLSINLKQAMIFVAPGTEIHPEDYIEEVWSTVESRALPLKDCEVETVSKVDTSKPGIYEIFYNIHTQDRMFNGITWLAVVVGDYGE